MPVRSDLCSGRRGKEVSQSYVSVVIMLALLSGTGGCQRRPPAMTPAGQNPRTDLLNYSKPINSLIDFSRVKKETISFRIEKAHYRLTVLKSGKPIKSYPVVFGGNPKGDKRQEGDGCTPEGKFRIRALYPHRRWSKFLWLDYPTPTSWRKFREAKRKGEISSRATIGGQVGIHGVPSGYDAIIDDRTNWTLGCISLKNADIAEIYTLAKVGTRVVVDK